MKRRRFSVEGSITVQVTASDVLARDEEDAKQRVLAAVLESAPGGRAGKDEKTSIDLDVDGPLNGADVSLDAWDGNAWGDNE